MVTTNVAIAALGAGIAVGAAGLSSGIGAGITGAAGAGAVAEDPKKFGLAIIFQAIPQTQGFYGFLVGILILFGSGILGGATDIPLPTALACLGAGLAIGIAGFSAIGQGIAAGGGLNASATEKGMFGKAMVFSVLPETQAIYGLLVAVLILAGGGVLGGNMNLTVAAGIGAVAAGLATGISGLSAIGQGIAANSGVSATAEDNSMFAKGMIFSVLPETQAIYGLLVAILILFFTGVTGAAVVGLGIPVSVAAVGAGLAIGIAGLSGIGQVIGASAGVSATAKDKTVFGKAMVFSVLPETQAIYGLLVAVLVLAGTGLLTGGTSTMSMAGGIAAVGAGIAIGLAGLSGIGQGIAAASGVAATAEDKGMFAKGMIFSVLPETQAIYGLLVAILIMYFTGIIGATAAGMLELSTGIAAVAAGLSIGLAGLSAIGQGIASGAATAATLKRSDAMGKGLILAVMPETFAILGLLIAILIMINSGLIGG